MRNDTAVVVLSGGQDSCACLFEAKTLHKRIFAITFDYNQRHSREIEAAKTIARVAGVEHHEIISLGPLFSGPSPLTNPDEALELYDDFKSMSETIGDRVELTFVPGRNLLFLAIAANRASVHGASAIYTGICQADGANYPDTTSKFAQSMVSTIALALGIEDIRIDAPLMDLSKAETIKLALTLPGCYTATGYSHTAYDGAYPPTGKDHATTLRAQGFEEAGVPDPLVVRAWFSGLMDLPETQNYTAWGDELGAIKKSLLTSARPMSEFLQVLEDVLVAKLNITQVSYVE